jgi:short-subunit dehydrogenase
MPKIDTIRNPSSSIQASDPSPNLLAYASSKAAIANFTKAFSKLPMKQAFG